MHSLMTNIPLCSSIFPSGEVNHQRELLVKICPTLQQKTLLPSNNYLSILFLWTENQEKNYDNYQLYVLLHYLLTRKYDKIFGIKVWTIRQYNKAFAFPVLLHCMNCRIELSKIWSNDCQASIFAIDGKYKTHRYSRV